jgi:hypothetical protein
MQLLGLIVILCLAMIYILAFWVRRMPSPHAADFAHPISRHDRRSMPAQFDKRALATTEFEAGCSFLGTGPVPQRRP